MFEEVRKLLCIGAHADDIEIGCGGLLARWPFPNAVEVRWLVFSANEQRGQEAVDAAEFLLPDHVERQVQVLKFSDGYFPAEFREIKQAMAAVAADFTPDLVLTHRLDDRHQDHRMLAELSWNHFRQQPIWEYEIPKYEGDLPHPNLYVRLDQEHVDAKLACLERCFPSQQQRGWFTPETFRGLMRVRGVECAGEWAEGFVVRKTVV